MGKFAPPVLVFVWQTARRKKIFKKQNLGLDF
jgi:hypothetical protein